MKNIIGGVLLVGLLVAVVAWWPAFSVYFVVMMKSPVLLVAFVLIGLVAYLVNRSRRSPGNQTSVASSFGKSALFVGGLMVAVVIGFIMYLMFTGW